MPQSPEPAGVDTLTATTQPVTATGDPFEIVAGPPAGDGWVLLVDALTDPSIIDGWFDQIQRTIPNGRKDVAGSYLASFLTGTIAAPLVRALVGQGRGWRLTAGATWVRVHEDGWLTGIAMSTPVLVLPTDPAADRTDTEIVANIDALTAIAVEHLGTLVTPLFTEVRSRAPYGLRGMWGALADSIAADLTWSAHVDGSDVIDAWQRAQPVIDALTTAAPTPVTRPTFERIEADGHTAHLTIRGTCCLYYQSRPDDQPVDYCSSCPMGNDTARQLRQQDWLRRQHASE